MIHKEDWFYDSLIQKFWVWVHTAHRIGYVYIVPSIYKKGLIMWKSSTTNFHFQLKEKKMTSQPKEFSDNYPKHQT